MRNAWAMTADAFPVFRNNIIAAVLAFALLLGVLGWSWWWFVPWVLWPPISGFLYWDECAVEIKVGEVGLLLRRRPNRQLHIARFLRPIIGGDGKPELQRVSAVQYQRVHVYPVGKEKDGNAGTIEFVVVTCPEEGERVRIGIAYKTRLDDDDGDLTKRFGVERGFMDARSGVSVDQRIQFYVVRTIVEREVKAVPAAHINVFTDEPRREVFEQHLAGLCDAEAYAQFGTHVTEVKLTASVSRAWKEKN